MIKKVVPHFTYENWKNQRDFSQRSAESMLNQALKAHSASFEDACIRKAMYWEEQANHFSKLLNESNPELIY
jgi:hypothetical protein